MGGDLYNMIIIHVLLDSEENHAYVYESVFLILNAYICPIAFINTIVDNCTPPPTPYHHPSSQLVRFNTTVC